MTINGLSGLCLLGLIGLGTFISILINAAKGGLRQRSGKYYDSDYLKRD